uniref:Uncharacterized protein n=1 Tax=Anguilla anguilla TaxID=7936 RepID=A0A0E9WXK6_ANGAN
MTMMSLMIADVSVQKRSISAQPYVVQKAFKSLHNEYNHIGSVTGKSLSHKKNTAVRPLTSVFTIYISIIKSTGTQP